MTKEWIKGPIEGVIINKLEKYLDERGFLCETYRADQLPKNLKPVMSYISFTQPGIARGPHEHTTQTDVFVFIGPGNFKLKLWDNRSKSPTYRHCMQIYAGRDSLLMVVIPPGVVHGYKNISATEMGMVLNYPDRLFMGHGKKEPVDEVRYEDEPKSIFKMD